MTTNVFTTPRMTSTPFGRDNTGKFGRMPTPDSYYTRREEDCSPRVSTEHANTVPEKQLVELIGEMFNNCMDNFMASRDVRPAKSEHSVSFSEVPLEYRNDPDRRVDTESVVVVSNLPKHADENFIRTVTLGCGEITKVLTSDLGANVGAQISFKNNDGTVKVCNQLNHSAYWQVNIAEEDRHKTAFISKYGQFQFKKLGFGLCNSPSTFSRVMNLVLHGLNWNIARAFLDDIMVMGRSFEEHLQNLRKVLDRFRRYGLKLKPKKCGLFVRKVEFLGRTVSKNNIEIGTSYTDTVANWPTPKCSKDVEKFLGFVNYHRMFIKNLAQLATPLYGLTGRHSFKWEVEQQTAFDSIKDIMCQPPVLAIPNQTGEFILDCDASDVAVAAELSQIQDGVECVIGYCSFALTPEQRRYCTTRLELLAVIRCTRQYKHLLGRKFTVRTDHNRLID